MFSARPAPFPGELQKNFTQLTRNSSPSVKHGTSHTVAGWEDLGAMLGKKPDHAHHPWESSREAEGNMQPVLEPCHRFSCLILGMSYCCFLAALKKGFSSSTGAEHPSGVGLQAGVQVDTLSPCYPGASHAAPCSTPW